MTNRLGRPSSFREQTADRICQLIANGQSLRAICSISGMPSRKSVLRWLEAREDFRRQYARAREAQADFFADEILEIADDSRNDWMDRQNPDGSVTRVVDHEHIQRSKLRIDARKWLMSKLAPKKYGDRQTLEHQGAEGNPILPVLRVVDAPPKETREEWLARRHRELGNAVMPARIEIEGNR
jgi:hypothetical protein